MTGRDIHLISEAYLLKEIALPESVPNENLGKSHPTPTSPEEVLKLMLSVKPGTGIQFHDQEFSAWVVVYKFYSATEPGCVEMHVDSNIANIRPLKNAPKVLLQRISELIVKWKDLVLPLYRFVSRD